MKLSDYSGKIYVDDSVVNFVLIIEASSHRIQSYLYGLR